MAALLGEAASLSAVLSLGTIPSVTASAAFDHDARLGPGAGAGIEPTAHSSERALDGVDETGSSLGRARTESTRRNPDGRDAPRTEEFALGRGGERERARLRDLEEPHFGGRAEGRRERRDGAGADRFGARDHAVPGLRVADLPTQFRQGVGEAMQVVRRRLPSRHVLVGKLDRSLATEEQRPSARTDGDAADGDVPVGESPIVQGHERRQNRSGERHDLPRRDLGTTGEDRRDRVATELEDDGRTTRIVDDDIDDMRDTGSGKSLQSIDEPHRSFLRDGRVERHDGHRRPLSGVGDVSGQPRLGHGGVHVTAVPVARSPEHAVPRDAFGPSRTRSDEVERGTRCGSGGLVASKR
jgi:hypothetical protein